MGVPKHGKDSARTKSSAKYKSENRREINKAKKQAKIAAGKKIKSHKGKKTVWMKWDNLIRNTEMIKPEVDSNIGVLWGVTKEKGKKKNKKKNKENKTD